MLPFVLLSKHLPVMKVNDSRYTKQANAKKKLKHISTKENHNGMCKVFDPATSVNNHINSVSM